LQLSFAGSKQKTSDEKRGNPKTQGAQNKRPPMKKEATSKYKGLKTKALVSRVGAVTMPMRALVHQTDGPA
jgi:hypothetical protein